MFYIQHRTGTPSWSNQARKRKQRHPKQKRESKTVFVCKWYHLIQRKSKRLNQKSARKKINKFRNIAGYKINTYKSVAFLYTTAKHLKKK